MKKYSVLDVFSWNYVNSDKKSIDQYTLEIDKETFNNLLPSQYSQTTLEENAVPCLIYRKPADTDNKNLSAQFFLSKYEKNHFNPDDITKYQTHEIQINDKNILENIENSIKEYNNYSSPLENYIRLEAARVKFYNEENEYGTEYPEDKDNEIYDALAKITYDEYLDKYAYAELDLKEIVGNDYFADNRCWSYLSDSIDSMLSNHEFIKNEKEYAYLFPEDFIKSSDELTGYGTLKYEGCYNFDDVGNSIVISGKSHDLKEFANDYSYKLNPSCLYEKDNLNLENAKKIRNKNLDILNEKETRICFAGIDSWNRPVFGEVLKNKNGKDIWGKKFFGSTDNLYSYGEELKVISDFKGKENTLCYFGDHFDCEPMGTSPETKLVLDVELSKKIHSKIDEELLSKEDIELCKQVIPEKQLDFTLELIKTSEEKDFYIKKLKEISDICRERTFSEPKEDNMPAFHYFLGNTHIYISELYEGNEKGKCNGYAFGYTILNGDLQMSEWGDSSFEEIKSIPNMEIDFYLDRSKSIDDILKNNYPEYFGALETKEEELEKQKMFLEESYETFSNSINNNNTQLQTEKKLSENLTEEEKKCVLEEAQKNNVSEIIDTEKNTNKKSRR